MYVSFFLVFFLLVHRMNLQNDEVLCLRNLRFLELQIFLVRDQMKIRLHVLVVLNFLIRFCLQIRLHEVLYLKNHLLFLDRIRRFLELALLSLRKPPPPELLPPPKLFLSPPKPPPEFLPL